MPEQLARNPTPASLQKQKTPCCRRKDGLTEAERRKVNQEKILKLCTFAVKSRQNENISKYIAAHDTWANVDFGEI